MRKAHIATMLLFLVVVLLLADFWQLVSLPSEKALERRRIAFDETHGEIHKIAGTYAAFGRLLQSSGFDVEPLVEGPFTLDRLRAYSVLVLPLPTKPFSMREIESICRFVQGGGGLLIVGDCGNDLLWGSNIINISQTFDVIFKQDAIRASQEPVVIEHFMSHPTTAGLTRIICHGGSSLETYGNATALAWVNDDTWADRYVGKIGVLEPEEAEGAKAPTVMAASQYGMGRIVCLGSSTLFLEPNLIPDHKKLGCNILGWLSSVEPVKTSIQNDLIRLKFLDDNLHSSYQIDIWDSSTRDWITAYHDVRFYTVGLGGFNVTWNMGNSTVETKSSQEYQFLTVRYPELQQFGHESAVIDVGTADNEHIVGDGWSRAFEFGNRTVREATAGRKDIHILADYPDHPWLQHTFSLTYADVGEGRVDINMLTPEGWITLKSFHIQGRGGWSETDVTVNPSDLYADPSLNKVRFGIHVEGEPLLVDKVSMSTVSQSGSIEVTAVIKKDSPLVYFYVRKVGSYQLSSIGIVGDLVTKSTGGSRFGFSSLLRDAYFERGHDVMPTQGVSLGEVVLGAGGNVLPGPTWAKTSYIYGEGWSEAFTTENGTEAREVAANETNTFLVIPLPSSLNTICNLNISYLDAGAAPVDINMYNGSQWLGIGKVKRENTCRWRTVTVPIPSSEMYLDPLAGGVKLGFFAYQSNFVISDVDIEASIVGEENVSVAFSGKKDDVVRFMVLPEAKDRLIQHEVDGPLGVIKTVDVLTRAVFLDQGGILPVAAVGSVIMDTSSLVGEVEEVIAEGWRPQTSEPSPIFVSGNLAVARLNGSSLSFCTSTPTAGKYRVFVKYYDLHEGWSDKEVAVYANEHEIGRIRYEGSGFYRFWSIDVELVKGSNTITLVPISKVPTSEIAYVDYVLVGPKFWEEEAIYELTVRIPVLIGD